MAINDKYCINCAHKYELFRVMCADVRSIYDWLFYHTILCFSVFGICTALFNKLISSCLLFIVIFIEPLCIELHSFFFFFLAIAPCRRIAYTVVNLILDASASWRYHISLCSIYIGFMSFICRVLFPADLSSIIFIHGTSSSLIFHIFLGDY